MLGGAIATFMVAAVPAAVQKRPLRTLQTRAALFIDGAPVFSASAFSAVSDPERIEVLKGP